MNLKFIYKIINIDNATYAADKNNIRVKNITNIETDIAEYSSTEKIILDFQPDIIVHFAAESHVDRSIESPGDFIQTNIVGTFKLLQASRDYWNNLKESKNEKERHENFRFLHVSTDEVYGSLGDSGSFTEKTPYAPNSPYAASKAASDHLVSSYIRTYMIPAMVTNCSNNYGPYEFPEKLLPLLINNCTQNLPIPVYGDGKNIRDWLFVEDHCEALDCVFHEGYTGETYNIGGCNEWSNIDIVRYLCRELDKELNRSGADSCENLITFVKDRPGHDRRYAINAGKIKNTLNLTPRHTFEEGLTKTIRWYIDHQDWVSNINTGKYRVYYKHQYG